MTYAPAPSTQPMTRHEIARRYVSTNHPLPKRHQAHPRNTSSNDFAPPWLFRHPFADLSNVLRRAFPFEKCLPPGDIFTSIALIIAKPPSGGRKLSFREAVLPLMYLVKEDGLQLGRCRPLNPMRTFRIADVDRSDWRPRRELQQGGSELWLMSVRQAAVAAVTC